MVRFSISERRAELLRPDGEVVRLRPKAFAMLQLLAANPGRILSKQELMTAVWPNIYVAEDSLFQSIREIRNALGDEQRQLLKAISGRGYLLEAEITREAAKAPVSADAPAPSSNGHDQVPAGAAALVIPLEPLRAPSRLRHRWLTPAVAAGACLTAISVGVALTITNGLIARGTPVIAVTPIVAVVENPEAVAMAADLTNRLTDGLFKIPNIRVLAPPVKKVSASPSEPASKAVPNADLVVRGELQKTSQSWVVHAQMVRLATGEVQWSTSYSVSSTNLEAALQQSRLAAGLGYPLALRISEVLHSSSPSNNAKVVTEQAMAAIKHTTRENFKIAQTILEKGLAENPDDVEIAIALAAHLLRGIQISWYDPVESAAAEERARKMLEHAARLQPSHIPVLQANCRFFLVTNQFAETLVACAKALTFGPWDGLVLFQIGMAQLQLGRFDEALATFLQADQFDTPDVSRWTWLLGAGLTSVLLDRPEEAVTWLQRSIAITPGTGRSHFVLAAALQKLGRSEEAKAAIAAGLKLRPGSTVDNVALPTKNVSPLYIARANQMKPLWLAAGLPKN